jgi:microcystin-dependent protein
MKNNFLGLLFLIMLSFPNLTEAQDPMIGEIKMFAGNFAPRGWALCEGQLLPISQYSALFSILGTTYGGDGRTTFALPDLRGRAPIQQGTGPGLSTFRLGQKGGIESINLSTISVDKRAKDKTRIVGDNGQRVSAVSVRNPYVAVNYIIALQGIYPSRN